MPKTLRCAYFHSFCLLHVKCQKTLAKYKLLVCSGTKWSELNRIVTGVPSFIHSILVFQSAPSFRRGKLMREKEKKKIGRKREKKNSALYCADGQIVWNLVTTTVAASEKISFDFLLSTRLLSSGTRVVPTNVCFTGWVKWMRADYFMCMLFMCPLVGLRVAFPSSNAVFIKRARALLLLLTMLMTTCEMVMSVQRRPSS